MRPRIDLITIVTADLPMMVKFYREVLGFAVKSGDDNYTEFESEGVRFALCTREVMAMATDDPDYQATPRGQRFELAFPFDNHDEVDQAYAEIISRGARAVKPPATMPWGQHTAFFADPDGNIHELFAG